MYIDAVNDNDVLNVLKQFENKLSTDNTGINMNIVKTVKHYIVKPFVYTMYVTYHFPVEYSQIV